MAPHEVKILELFSGIGGMRCALASAGIQSTTITAADVNTECNMVYNKSYGDKPQAKNIASAGVKWFDSMDAVMWTMSPPCQPYTRQGKQQDSDDCRANALGRIIEVLGRMKNPPRLILLENVVHFERSASLCELLHTLHKIGGYRCRGFMLSPMQFGFPNSRSRFYLMAIRDEAAFSKLPSGTAEDADTLSLTVYKSIPCVHCNEKSLRVESKEVVTPIPGQEGFELVMADIECDCEYVPREIGQFLDTPDSLSRTCDVPRATLEKPSSFCFDIVSAKSLQSMCFTKAYRKFHNGTGSVLLKSQTPTEPDSWDEMGRPHFRDLKSMTELVGQLRYFTPSEIARLQGFPLKSDGNRWRPALCSKHEEAVEPREKRPKIGEDVTASLCTDVEELEVPVRALVGMLGNSLNPEVVSRIITVCEIGDFLARGRS
ncbi:C-5 cytosine-specific DNA methylase [Perkinsus olseni]|uniref:C-5 cytosine-specific DNA methylase n=1 Tax=Perkinsus olseni TaxID=32597 RepID=A0A7J6UPK7_PEROL|nr:C-5 cytosine-specific DNA methylase [Perkinsus olseni]